MRLAIGSITLLCGLALLVSTRLERDRVPANFQRLALGIACLGAGTLAALPATLTWNIVSSVMSLVAILLIGSVVLENLRR